MSLLYKNDIGVRLLIDTGNLAIPVSAVLTVKLTKPSGIVISRVVQVSEVNYSTGIITYTTASGDLSEVGEYKIQVRGVFDTGEDYKSDIDTFEVNEPIVEMPITLNLDYMIK